MAEIGEAEVGLEVEATVVVREVAVNPDSSNSSSKTPAAAAIEVRVRVKVEIGVPDIAQTRQNPSVTAIIDMGRKLGTVSSLLHARGRTRCKNESLTSLEEEIKKIKSNKSTMRNCSRS